VILGFDELQILGQQQVVAPGRLRPDVSRLRARSDHKTTDRPHSGDSRFGVEGAARLGPPPVPPDPGRPAERCLQGKDTRRLRVALQAWGYLAEAAYHATGSGISSARARCSFASLGYPMLETEFEFVAGTARGILSNPRPETRPMLPASFRHMPLCRTVGIISQILAQSCIFALVACLPSAAQAETTLLDAGYRQMYDLQFDQAHRTFSEWQRLHPEDPIASVSDAATYLFTEFDRLHILEMQYLVHGDQGRKLVPDPVLKQKFETALNRAMELATKTPQDANTAFALVLCHGLRSEYLGLIEKRYAPALKEIKTARILAQQLLVNHPDNYDAWIAVGVENYFLGIKSAPLRWALRMGGGQTDRTLGIAELQLTADKGHYLAPFARLLLAVAALRDRNTDRAHDLLAALAHDFPHNPLYTQELAKLTR